MQSAQLMKKYYSQNEEFLGLALLAVFINGKASPEHVEKLVDFCTTESSYFSIMQLTMPQLVSYLVVAMALNKTLQLNRAFDLFKLVEVLNRKLVKHEDALTRYISLLEIEFDFEGARNALAECSALIKEDFLLAPHHDRIIEGLHFLYFKLACKMYDSIPLKEVSDFTGKPVDDA